MAKSINGSNFSNRASRGNAERLSELSFGIDRRAPIDPRISYDKKTRAEKEGPWIFTDEFSSVEFHLSESVDEKNRAVSRGVYSAKVAIPVGRDTRG